MTAVPAFEVYFDFDNTVTDFDVLDEIIQRFSVNEDWKLAEAAWAAGSIGSRDCLARQLAQVRVSADALRDYLRPIRIDPAFAPILALLRSRGLEPVILSDSFTPVISAILENNGVAGLVIFANELRLEGDVPVVAFPYFNSICSTAANCKTSHLFRRQRPAGTRKIYVGDGQSDICPAGFCEILFAKGRLFRHYSALRRENCFPFENLSTVLSHLQLLLA
jgi:2,3-diketo-5-methylthio-1-phosphopentane phosphatase